VYIVLSTAYLFWDGIYGILVEQIVSDQNHRMKTDISK
jgi:hypothetical protein